jgi:FkbM family methyltransferase
MIERATIVRHLQRVFWSPLGLRAVEVGAAIGKRWNSIVLNRALSPDTNGEDWLAELLPASPLVIDAGFHCGGFTHAVLKARPEARVIGFEPAASIRDVYNKRHASNPRIAVEPIALSNAVGEFTFHDDATGNNSLAPIAHTERTVSYQVKTTTLHAYAEEAHIEHIDMLKIDVEGYEMHVLEGASDLLDRQAIDIFVFEYNAPWVLSRRYLRDACEYIGLKPYRLFRLYNGFLSPFEYTFTAERFDTAAMYVGVSEKRLERGGIPFRTFPDFIDAPANAPCR